MSAEAVLRVVLGGAGAQAATGQGSGALRLEAEPEGMAGLAHACVGHPGSPGERGNRGGAADRAQVRSSRSGSGSGSSRGSSTSRLMEEQSCSLSSNITHISGVQSQIGGASPTPAQRLLTESS